MEATHTHKMTIYIHVLCTKIHIQTMDGQHRGSSSSLPGMWDMIEATTEFLKTDLKILPARLSVANMISNIGYAIKPDDVTHATIAGRNLETGYPDRLTVSSIQLYDVLEPYIVAVIGKILHHAETENMLLEVGQSLSDTITLVCDYPHLRDWDIAIETAFYEILSRYVDVVFESA